MASARPYPPSAQRIAAARAGGHVPRPLLVATAAGCMSLFASVLLLAPRGALLLSTFARESLLALGSGRREAAYALLASLQRELTELVCIALLISFSAVASACALAQGVAFGFTRARAGASFGELAPDRTAALLWAVGLVAMAASAIADALLSEPHELTSIASSWARQLLLLALGCAFIDAALARARFHGSLWLTRREYLDEQRAAHGAPEVRALRARRRSELVVVDEA